MQVLLSGASGLIGRALGDALRAGGHDVRRLVRRPAGGPDEIAWDPAARRLDARPLADADAIVNLAGENVGQRWTTARRQAILRSRVDGTRTLVAALARLERKPAVLVNASAVGLYGDRGDEVLTESSAPGTGFLAEVCLAWEAEAQLAATQGVRTVLARFGVVLAPRGGALERMLPLFRLGLGGPLGDGRQWMSWVSLDDAVGALLHALTHAACTGPLNVVAPAPVTNREFTRALGRALRRPAVLPAPAWALRLALGQMADEALLGSARVMPRRLAETGYRFRHETLEQALAAVGGG